MWGVAFDFLVFINEPTARVYRRTSGVSPFILKDLVKEPHVALSANSRLMQGVSKVGLTVEFFAFALRYNVNISFGPKRTVLISYDVTQGERCYAWSG